MPPSATRFVPVMTLFCRWPRMQPMGGRLQEAGRDGQSAAPGLSEKGAQSRTQIYLDHSACYVPARGNEGRQLEALIAAARAAGAFFFFFFLVGLGPSMDASSGR